MGGGAIPQQQATIRIAALDDTKKDRRDQTFLILKTDTLGSCTCQNIASEFHDDLRAAFMAKQPVAVLYTEDGANPKDGGRPYRNIVGVTAPGGASPRDQEPVTGHPAVRASNESKAVRANVMLAVAIMVQAKMVDATADGFRQAFTLVTRYVDEGLEPYGSEQV